MIFVLSITCAWAQTDTGHPDGLSWDDALPAIITRFQMLRDASEDHFLDAEHAAQAGIDLPTFDMMAPHLTSRLRQNDFITLAKLHFDAADKNNTGILTQAELDSSDGRLLQLMMSKNISINK